MNKYILLALACGFFGCATSPTLQQPETQPLPQPEATTSQHSAQLSGNTIHLIPSGATFELPQKWKTQRGVTLFLSRTELNQAKFGEGEWDTEYGEIINSIFPFEQCVMHAGEETWLDGSSFHDLQMRAYLGNWEQDQLLKLIRETGPVAARRFSQQVSFEENITNGWHRARISFHLWYSDYGGTAIVEIYSKSWSSTTAVLVFMYCSDPRIDRPIANIVSSFDLHNVNAADQIPMSSDKAAAN